jgi:hypothetical protein
MRTHYDFSKMEGRRNPYTKHLKQSKTCRTSKLVEKMPSSSARFISHVISVAVSGPAYYAVYRLGSW